MCLYKCLILLLNTVFTVYFPFPPFFSLDFPLPPFILIFLDPNFAPKMSTHFFFMVRSRPPTSSYNTAPKYFRQISSSLHILCFPAWKRAPECWAVLFERTLTQFSNMLHPENPASKTYLYARKIHVDLLIMKFIERNHRYFPSK